MEVDASVAHGADALALFEASAMAESSPCVFTSASWVQAAWSELPQLGDPLVLRVAARGGERLLPLAVRRTAEQLTITMAGGSLGDEHDFTGTVALPTGAMQLGLRRLVHEYPGAPVHLDGVLPRGLLGTAVVAHPDWLIETEPAPVIPKAEIKETRGQLRRRHRLHRHGSLDIRVDECLPHDHVADFVRRRLARWRCQGRVGQLPAVERSPGFPRFMAQAVAGLAAAGLARMWELWCGGRRAAEDLHLGSAADPLLYMRNYDWDLRHLSPGRVLLESTILELHRAGVERLRTGRGDEAYKFAAGATPAHVLTVSRAAGAHTRHLTANAGSAT